MTQSELSEQQILQMARIALGEGQFVPYYQPQINIMTEAINGTEALARWIHPEYGMIMPDVFIPVLEKSGLIYDLDKYMWNAVCRDIRRWRDEGISLPSFSVNLSRWDITRPDLIQELLAVLKENKLSPGELHLEITESAYLQDPKALLKLMKELEALGFFVEMDDFGSGYSSLTALKDLPFNLIKLDAGLLRESGEIGKTGTILAGIIRLIRQLDIPMIAEGVENVRQAEYLKSTGCYTVQGYLFSKPLPGEEYIAFLKARMVRKQQMGASGRETAEVNFLDYHTQEDLLFNQYVGAACILELQNGHIAMLRANDRFFSGLKLSRAAYASESFASRVLDAPSYELLRSTMEKAIKTGIDQGCELQTGAQNPEEKRWFQVRVHLLSGQSGSALFYCDGTDNTESKLLRRSLDSAEKLYRSVIEATESAILVSDADTGDFLFANRVALSFFHMPEEEILQMKFHDCPQLSDVSLPKGIHGDGEVYDTYLKFNDRSIHLRCVFAHWNDRPAVISYLWDNTELVAFSDRMERVLSDLPSGVSIYELQNGVFSRIYMSDVGAMILDYMPGEDALNGFQVEIERMLPEDREKSAASFAAIPKTMEPGEYEFRIRCRDGSVRWISFRYRPAYNAVTAKWELYAVYSDVTAKRNAEETMRQNEMKYRIAALQTNKMICTYVPENRILVVSDETSKAFDSVSYMKDAPEEFIRQSYIAEESREAWLGLFAAIERGDKTGTVPELGIATLTTGEMFWYSAAFTAIQNEEGKTVSAVLAFDNITESRNRQQAQSKSITKIQSLLSFVGGDTMEALVILNPSEKTCEEFTAGSHDTYTIDRYYDAVRHRSETITVPEERARFLRNAMLENVLAHLKRELDYRFVYTGTNGRREAEFRWLNDSRREIVMILRKIPQLPTKETTEDAGGTVREILSLAQLGIWRLELVPGKPNKLYADNTFADLMGFSSGLSPEECYRQWESRIDAGYRDRVQECYSSLSRGEQTDDIYLWRHPVQGDIFIRFSGYRDPAYKGEGCRICGFYQIVNGAVNREMELTARLKNALDSFKQADYDKRRDYLTGLYNRLDMYELLHDPMSARRDHITAMYMMDIDNFKLLNDHYGHRRGDECLRAIGQALTQFGAANDMRFYRYGGEELLGICFGSDRDPRFIAAALLRIVYDLKLERDDMPLGRVTVSIGYSTGHGNYEQMLDQADAAMYRAKAKGKNRFVLFEAERE